MFSTSNSVLLVLLVITCFQYYTECDDELMTDFCLNTDTPVYMDSSTVQRQEILTTFSILATTNPDQQDHTEHLHTVQSTRGSGSDVSGAEFFEVHKTSIPVTDVVSVEETTSDSTLPGVILTTKKKSQMYADPEDDLMKQIISQTEIKEKTMKSFVTGVNKAGLCCFKFNKIPVPATIVVSVEDTRIDCTLPGVIVTTKKGFRMCADPEVDWVKEIISQSEKKLEIIKCSVTDANGADLCCFEFPKSPIPAVNIVSVAKTRYDCTLPGVILTTTKGLHICADPEVDWVKQIIESKSKPS